MPDGETLFLYFLVFCFVLGFALAAYLDWGSKHLDKVPEWVRRQLIRNRHK